MQCNSIRSCGAVRWVTRHVELKNALKYPMATWPFTKRKEQKFWMLRIVLIAAITSTTGLAQGTVRMSAYIAHEALLIHQLSSFLDRLKSAVSPSIVSCYTRNLRSSLYGCFTGF